MPTLLTYAQTTDPFPLQASAQSGNANVATLTLVATNTTSDGVTLDGMSITLPIGAGATQLTADTIDIGPVPPANWTLAATQYPTGAIQYIFQPASGDGTVGSNESLVFVFNNIKINTQPGPVEVVVMEGSNGCQPPECPTANLYLTKFPNGWGTVSFWANPVILPYNSGPTLYWSGPAGATYTIEYYMPQTGIVNVPAPGQPSLANEGQYPAQGGTALQLEQDTTFYLMVVDTIGNQTYSAQQSVPVTVELPAPQIKSFAVAPAQAYTYAVTYEGQTTTQPVTVELTWTTENAQSCVLSGESHLLVANGSLTRELSQTTQFTLTAQGETESSALQTIEASVESIVGVEVSFTAGTLSYTLNFNVPPTSLVMIELLMAGTAIFRYGLDNTTDEWQSSSYSGAQSLSEWDVSKFSVSVQVSSIQPSSVTNLKSSL